MSNVVLHIGGREYKVACADGEEAHIADLGRLIDRKLSEMSGSGTMSEPRLLLFAALLLADEVHELRQNAGSTPAPAASPAPALASIAERLEKLADALESSAATP